MYVKRYPAGEFRQEVSVSRRGALYLFPEHIASAMTDIQSFLENEKELHALIKIILFLSFVSYTHPFQDGNGTIVRIYVAVLLLQSGYLYTDKLNDFA